MGRNPATWLVNLCQAHFVTLAGLCLSAVLLSSAVRADEEKPSLEFRIADTVQHAGWKKTTVRGSDDEIFVSDQVVLSGSQIEQVSFAKGPQGAPLIGMQLTQAGGQALEKATAENLNRKVAILLNGTVISAPTIRDRISRNVQITGDFDRADLLSFFHVIVLRELPSD